MISYPRKRVLTNLRLGALVSQREPVFNIPGCVLLLLIILIAVHASIAVLARMDFVSANQLVNIMAFFPVRYSGAVHNIPGGEWADITSFFTYMFVNFSLGELVMNGLLLLAFGSFVARRLGNTDFFIFSILSGMCGAGLHLILNWGSSVPLIGFSAVIYGYMVAAFLIVFSAYTSNMLPYLRENVTLIPLARPLKALTDPRLLGLLFLWIGSFLLLSYFNVGGGDFSKVQWEPHLGGILGGMVGLWVLDKPVSA